MYDDFRAILGGEKNLPERRKMIFSVNGSLDYFLSELILTMLGRITTQLKSESLKQYAYAIRNETLEKLSSPRLLLTMKDD
jgi:hypothetical protein